jgi:hypothetical protein
MRAFFAQRVVVAHPPPLSNPAGLYTGIASPECYYRTIRLYPTAEAAAWTPQQASPLPAAINSSY